MKNMNKTVGKFLSKKLEEQSMKVADSSMSKACFMFVYEPKSPFVKMQEKNENK
ncbi:cyclic lactone autoinducer peptide [Listeria ivanovii]|uniref:Accessory gene regulator protein D n=3 Tax=Listeria ivanovii TaxID=1638 RepID=G2Z8S6_LISIP|nr:cyclic lactone autoinducer peptide [Listeria ivanovii]EFR98525.1 accessory gene regulator protein D, putative [Listeria ivanovii FSL F6-596]AHI54672.1 accessory gene regulator D [Listeria ivanovii WSLC3009]AIS58548.1 accessory gene regulator AgrD [Listeria ivanovii subsp. londoniensis]AIS61302.1 accessory gene regulator AgrD [Listeria ivanovii subsp. londoniensis]AIS64140.1 accessory gene regulator AgrD [Listeria ivanovii subsp. ivanovii]